MACATCSGGSTPAKSQGKCSPKGAAMAPPCLQPIEGNCATDLTIIQGEDLDSQICFSGMVSQARCIYPDGKITTADNMGSPSKVRIACTGSEWQYIAGTYNVAASTPANKELMLSGLAVPQQKCFESVMKNIPGCTAVAQQTPPTVIEHIDASDWVFEGRIYTRRSTTTSRQLFGVHVTPGSDTIYYTIDRHVHVGDALCIYLPSGTLRAKALRVSCGEIVDDCGDTVKATFVEIDSIIGTVPDDSCVAMSVDAGVLADLDVSANAGGCARIRMPWTTTRNLPFLAYCDETHSKPSCDSQATRFLGYWDLFGTMSYMSGGVLQTTRKRLACGCVYVAGSSAGIYSNCD